jgi:hypothetical protein
MTWVRGSHLLERGEQVGGALRLFGGREALDVAPLDLVGLAAPAEALGGALLQGDPADHPVAVARLLHGQVVDEPLGAGLLDGDPAVEHLAEHQRLRRALLEAAHVDQAGGDDLARVDAGHPCHRHEDRAPPEHLDDQAQHPGRKSARTEHHDEVADLAHLVAGRVEHLHAGEACDEDSGRGGAHVQTG